MKPEVIVSSDIVKGKKLNRKFKRGLVIFILLATTVVILGLKLPYFNISKITVQNNLNIPKESIIDISKIQNGNNIFYFDSNLAKSLLLKNEYIENVSIKRILPSTINIDVDERKITYFYNDKGKYLVIGTDGVLIEKRNDIISMKLASLLGFEFSKSEVGKKLKCNENRKFDAINQIGELILNNNSNHIITKVDVSDVLNINVYFDNICVKIGSIENVKNKLNMAINILSQNALKGSKGYIDVSFEANPVFSIQK